MSEVLLWQHIKQKGYDVQFHRQVPILEYIVDFYCHELKLVIEVDGESHYFKDQQDIKRQSELEAWGIIFLRFSDIDIKQNLFSVLLVIEETVSRLIKK